MHRALLECFPNVTTLILKQSLSGLRNVPWWKTVIPEISQSRITTLKVLYSDVSLDLTAALAIFPNLVSLGEVDLSTARSWGRATSTYPSVTSLHVRLSLDALADLNELSAWLESAAPHILRLLPRLRRLGIQPVRIHLPMRAGFTSEPLPPPTATLLDQDKFSQPWHAFVRGLAVQDIVLRSVRDEVHGDVSGSMGRSGGGGGGALGQAHNRMYDALELALRAACVCAGKRFRHDVGMADGSAEGDDE
ncbi:hypothetical protein M427DRAFT_59063 [Gonapodya prolifera JEL478]|uniref:Uncharacterized protein n=1 Tax=Gonapodya prolifera (strain JEL478) TaxID=1344416 RepID=A0A139A812_GONPJ|nr:hypothetical protein M427DRAFT_59063 [Gonapodya prolifera JEL478]|eukprot:KXS12951.1 hypothetical protein M427DRAFT_59063 [Gonapodya prolifera JEL478]